jgi:hypothetical protein
MSALYCALIGIFSSCSLVLPVQKDAPPSPPELSPLSNSIVFVIHGDGEYLYHDTAGNEYNADDVVLASAKRVAEHNPGSEVLIFHQKKGTNFMFLFPQRDGEWYRYRNGSLIATGSYWRGEGVLRFEPEAEVYRRFSANGEVIGASIFLYFGHEIPESSGKNYDKSYPDQSFTVDDLAAGLQSFTNDTKKFDLLVLSTCYGGTPYTIGTLGPYATTIIASPENLHLSYFDLRYLEWLEINTEEGSMSAYADRFAREAFDRLSERTLTTVAVAVYDVDRVQDFLRKVRENPAVWPVVGKMNNPAKEEVLSPCDCSDDPAFTIPSTTDGVKVYFRPALFGRTRNKQSHSGWGCRTGKEVFASPSKSTVTAQ